MIAIWPPQRGQSSGSAFRLRPDALCDGDYAGQAPTFPDVLRNRDLRFDQRRPVEDHELVEWRIRAAFREGAVSGIRTSGIGTGPAGADWVAAAAALARSPRARLL